MFEKKLGIGGLKCDLEYFDDLKMQCGEVLCPLARNCIYGLEINFECCADLREKYAICCNAIVKELLFDAGA